MLLTGMTESQTTYALLPWTFQHTPANPQIRLDMSGLTGVDIDHGLEGLSDDEILTLAERNGQPRTYTIRTGRATGGATFFYRGVRSHPDVYGFKIGTLSGDIKCHGHVAAAGSLYRDKNPDGTLADTFTTYRCIK